MSSEDKPKDVLSLMRLPALGLIALVYNVLMLFVFRKFGATFLAFSILGYSILATLLVFRHSERIQRWLLQSAADKESFTRLLSLPLWLWAILPSISLLVNLLGLWD